MPQEPGRRRLPFLHRNWTVGVAASQEWAPKRRLPANCTSTLPPSSKGVDEDPYLHPSKRQRVCPSPPGAIEDVVKLPQRPGDRSNGLRIQVFNVFHQDTPRLRFANGLSAKDSSSEITRYNARFKVTILSERYGKPVLMYCAAQIGAVQAIRASNNGRYGLAKLVLEPFTVPLADIAVLHRDGDMFGLADKYMLRIEIESTASNEPWPPLDLLSLTGANRHGSDYRPKKASDCVLCAESSDFFGRPRMRIPIWIRESMQHDAVRTNFVMDMDVRWTTGFLERPRRHLNLGVLPTIVALHPDEPLPPPTLDLCDLWPRRRSYRAELMEAAAKKKAASAVLGDITNGHTNGFVPGTMNGTTNGTVKGATNSAVEGITNGVVTNVFTNGSTTPSDLTGQLQNQINNQLSREINDQVNGHASGTTHAAGPTTVVNDDTTPEDWLDSPNPPSRASRTRLDCPTTPNRPRRARVDQPEYNVRKITNKAHNIQSKNGRSRGSKMFAGVNGHINGSIYAANSHIKVIYYYQYEHVTVEGFQCCLCMAANPDLDHLRLHFLSHHHYTFQYEPWSARGVDHVFRITHNVDTGSARLQDTVYQLGRPTKALNVERFLQGDESWLTSRFGPLNDDKVVKNAQLPRSKAKPASVATKLPTPTPAPPKPKPKKKVLVPATRQPLYDPLSKGLLQPGSALRTNIVDDSWRIHKHREIVQDYSDLTHAEKEFIQEWDRFIILKRIASDAYIPRAMVQFIEDKGLWLVSDLNRAMEFGKLMAVMIAHDILTDENVDEVTKAMDAAWALKRSMDPGDSQAVEAANSTSAPKVYALRRGTGGCPICGFRCAVADSVICCNKECARRQYHTACLRKTALTLLILCISLNMLDRHPYRKW
ncbi:hypothetical protein SBRCBS47491_007154 [Sporothrix bragantina]|uniref:Polycomb protein VEFS-Box domain-containing protein n=1 Tax=Sporothrix bragantina TaxID=671064 RepID=A0ABP0CAQ4_9PEZI